VTHLIGAAPPSFLVADDVTIAAKVKATLNDVALADAIITSAGQKIQGALEAAHIDARPLVSGTFDAGQLAIAPLFGPPRSLRDPDGKWSLEPFGVAPSRNFDLDLRLSAGALNVYGRELFDAAASLMLKDGVLTGTLIDAAAYRGRLNGEARIECIEGDLDIHAHAKLADADFGAAFSDFGWQASKGMGEAEFILETSGRSPASAVARLSGSGTLKSEQGAIAGVNLEEALRRSQRRPIDVERDMRIGGTAFNRLAIEFAIADGIAHIVNGELAAQGVTANLEGAIDLPGQVWNLRVNAMQTDSAGEKSPDAAQLSLDIEGPWSSPTIRAAGSAPASLGRGEQLGP
jgi:AsmA protein